MIEINKYKLDPSSICLPGTITTWGAIIGDITKQQDLVDYVAEHGGGGSAAEWGSITGDIMDQSDLESWLTDLDSRIGVNDDRITDIENGTVVPTGIATQTWVGQQGYLVQSDLSQYATRQWVTGRGYITSDALNGYATESWVGQQGYITSSALSWGNITGDISEQTDLNEELSQYVPWDDLADTLGGYAQKSWVQEQGYASDSDLTSLASRVTTLETNYGDAITITNNILG